MTKIETDGFLSDEASEGRAVFRDRFSGVFALADDVNRTAVRKLGEAKLCESGNGRFVLYLLTIRIVESYEAIILLMEMGMQAPAKLIVRPILEALFTLAALQKDEALVDRYFDMQEKAHFEILRSSTRWRNEVLKNIFKESELEAKYIDKKQALQRTPPRTLRPIEWARAADYEDLYHVYYVQYASFTHSNVSALEDHIDRENAEAVEASFGPSIDGFYDLLRNASAFTLIAIMHMCAAFGLDIQDDAARIHEAIKKLDADNYETNPLEFDA